MMVQDVVLHVYDVTNSDSEKTNNTILQINRIFKDRIGLGGIFHSAIQVYGDEEWSFGFCEQGSGVFSCPPSKNPLYTYRERIVLGQTSCSIFKVSQILRDLSQSWTGHSYDLLSRNCNHFCNVFCERLGVPRLPGWVNRFANAADTTMVVAGNTAFRLRQAKDEIVTASKVAYRFMVGLASISQTATLESPSSLNRGSPRFQVPWPKNLESFPAKPSSFMAGLASNSEEATPESSGSSNSGSPRFQVPWLKNLSSIGAKPSTSDSNFTDEDDDIPLRR